MELDDLMPRKVGDPLDMLEFEELEGLSLDELSERVRRLKREIERIEETLMEKDKGLADARAAFKG